MTDEDQLYSHIPNCTDIENVKALNKALDVEQTFSDFKKYHKKPCANFALTYQKKLKVGVFCWRETDKSQSTNLNSGEKADDFQ